jgi:hypothetical protein
MFRLFKKKLKNSDNSSVVPPLEKKQADLTFMDIDYWKQDSLKEPPHILLEQTDLALKRTDFENDEEFRDVVITNLVYLLGLENMQSHIQETWSVYAFSWAGIFGTRNKDIQSLWVDLYNNKPFLNDFFWYIRPILQMKSENLGDALDHVAYTRQDGAGLSYVEAHMDFELQDDFSKANIIGKPSEIFTALNYLR